MKRVGILYRPIYPLAEEVARDLAKELTALEVKTWIASAWETEAARAEVVGTELLLCVGGDGTILRAARIAAPWPIPILGVNLGKVGFLAEVEPEEAFKVLPAVLASPPGSPDSRSWVERRAMLQAQVQPAHPGAAAPPYGAVYHALNDVVVGRGARARLVQVEARVADRFLATYRADAVIAASATGSTGYALAAGGPVLPPESEEIVLIAAAPHLSRNYPLVLPAQTQVSLVVQGGLEPMLSVDGQLDFPLAQGDVVLVSRSPHQALFLRLHPPEHFWATLGQRLRQRENQQEEES